MPDSDSDRSQRERDLDSLIAEFYQAVERGQGVDQAEFLKRHPDSAAEMREFFENVERIEKVAVSVSPILEETQPVATSTPGSLIPGTVVRYFGDYEILEELGAGGMGVVYKARQVKLNRIVALKMIKVGQLASEDEVRRFQAEARAAAKLDHPGIVPVHEVGVHYGQHYYVMDYVAGGSLSKLHRDEPVAARRAAELIEQLSQAMHYAHGQGIIHRDLKPANVLLSSGGAPRITDFGLAKRLWSEEESAGVSTTETGQVLGTVGYMSPEQATGKTRLVGPPADIYALGAVLYALLTGRAPFVGESQADIILQVIQKEPVSPRILNPSVARDLETICLKCLEKEPHKRYGTAQLLADDLVRFLDHRPVLARPISRLARAWRWCRRNPWAATALLLLLILGVGSPPVAWRQYQLTQTTIGQKNEITAALEKVTTAEGKERAARATAESEAAAKSQTLYISDMKRMEFLWQEKDLRTMRALLARHVPQPGHNDLRDFEWHYWNHQCNRQRRKWQHGQSVTQMALSPDGKWLATAALIDGSHSTIQVVNLTTGSVEQTSPVIPSAVAAIQFTDGGQSLLLFQSFARRPQQWKWQVAGQVPEPKEIGDTIKGSPFLWRISDDGKLIGRSLAGYVSCLRWPDFESLTIEIGNDPAALDEVRKQGGRAIRQVGDSHFTDFQTRVPGVNRSRYLHISDTPMHEEGNWAKYPSGRWDPVDEQAPPEEEDGGPAFSLDFSASEDRLAAGSRHGELFIWDLKSGAELVRLDAHQDIIWDVAFSPDGTLIATASKDGAVKVWKTTGGQLVATAAGHVRGTRTVEFLDSNRLVSGGDDNCVRVWSSASGAELAEFAGHEQTVLDVVAATDDDSIFSASRDGTIRQWSLADHGGSILIADRTPIASIALFPDEQFLAGTGGTGDVTVWELGCGRIHATLRGQFDDSYHVRVAPDGDSIVAGAWGGNFTRWDARTGKLLARRTLPILRNTFEMSSAAISPDAQRVAARCPDDKVRVFDIDTGLAVATIDSDLTPVRVLFSPDGKQVLTAGMSPDGRELYDLATTMQLWNAKTGELISKISERTGHVAAFAPSGASLAVCRQVDPNDRERLDLEIVVINLPSQEVAARLPVPAGVTNVRGLAISPDGLRLAAIARSPITNKSPPAKPALLIYDLAAKALAHHWEDEGNQVHFTHSGRQVLVAGIDGRVRVRRLAEETPTSELMRSAGPVVSAVWSRKDRKLAVVGDSGEQTGFLQSATVYRTVVSVDQPTQQEQRQMMRLYSPKASFIGLADGSFAPPGTLYTEIGLDTATQFRFRVVTGRPYMALEAYAEQANYAFLTTPDGALIRGIVDGQGRFAIAEQAIPRDQTALAMAAASDGRRVALAIENRIELWDGEKLARLSELTEHAEYVRALEFSGDGSYLASGGSDRTVRIWNTSDGSLVATCLGHTGSVTSLAFSRSGRTLASASRDGTIQLWDVASGESKTMLVGHTGPVHWVEFSPDGSELVSVGEDGTVRLWKAPGAGWKQPVESKTESIQEPPQ